MPKVGALVCVMEMVIMKLEATVEVEVEHHWLEDQRKREVEDQE